MTKTIGPKWLHYVVFSIIAATVLSTLVSSHIFIYSSLTPVFAYCLGVSILLVFTASIMLFQKKIEYKINFQILVAVAWLLYVLFHGIINNDLNLFHYYLIINIILFLLLIWLLKTFSDSCKFLFVILNIFAFGESVICIGQYFKLVDSFNGYFAVTGSGENPNVTAMFLVMALSACWINTYLTKGIWNMLVKASILIIMGSLFMLQCRTAIIGLIAEILVVGNYQFGLLDQFRSKKSRSLAILATIFLGGIIALLSIKLYKVKQASADGRKLIYKISAQMILNKPVTGYGYGTFEKNYNLAQADYFKNGNGTSQEEENADFVRMGYNEFLQNGVEGGLIGMALLILLFYSLLNVSFDADRYNALNPKGPPGTVDGIYRYFIASYAGVAAFVIMSVFNFSIQAAPAMCMCMLYSALIVIHSRSKRYPLIKEHGPNKGYYFQVRLIAGATVLLVGLMLCWYALIAIRGNYLNKIAQIEAKKGHYDTALNILNLIGPDLGAYESYWTNYANIAMDNKNFNNAIIGYTRAKGITSNPSVYMKIAQCYETNGDYSNAEQNLLNAKYIQPNRLQPRFDLMNLYLKMKDTSKAALEAKWIAAIHPKIPSKETDFYKYYANMLMNRLGHPYSKAFSSPFNFRKASYFTRKKV